MDRATTLINRGNNLVALFTTLTGPAHSTERTRIARIVRNIGRRLHGETIHRMGWHWSDTANLRHLGWSVVR